MTTDGPGVGVGVGVTVGVGVGVTVGVGVGTGSLVECGRDFERSGAVGLAEPPSESQAPAITETAARIAANQALVTTLPFGSKTQTTNTPP